MTKNLFLTLCLFLASLTGVLKAQNVYDLYDMTDNEFASGGNVNAGWSFERYDKELGKYAPFAMYDDSSKINVTDTYAYYRFGGEIKGNIKEDIPWGQPDNAFDPAYYSLYDSRSEFVYIGNKAAMFETQSSKQISPAFVFTAPEDGYYKIEMSVQNQDAPTGRFDPYPMIVNRYRYAGQDDINYVNQLSNMGMNVSYCQNGIFVVNGSELPDGTIADRNWYTPFQPESYYIYFMAKQGDKITVEPTYGNGVVNLSDFHQNASLWNRTRWHDLKAIKVDQTEAIGNERFVDPYGTFDDSRLVEIVNEAYDLQMAANPGKNKGQYPALAIAEFDAVIRAYEKAESEDAINVMTVKVWEITLSNAIAEFKSRVNEVTWAEHYKLFPFDEDDENELSQHNAWFSEQVTAENKDAVRWKFLSYRQETGAYTLLPTYDIGGGRHGFTETEAWHDGGGWFFLARNGKMHPENDRQPVIMFTAPVAGYYKVYSAIQSDNTNDQMNARFRFVPSTEDVNSMNVPKESFLVNMTYRGKGMPSDTSFYVMLKAGDRLTFEQDCYTRGGIGSAASSWQELAIIDLQKEYSTPGQILAVIEADNERVLIDPYSKGDFTDLIALITECKEFVASVAGNIGLTIGKYPEMAKLTFEEVISEAEEMVADDLAPQYEIDIMKAKLETALAVFETTKVDVMCDPVGQNVGGEEGIGKLVSGAYYIKSPSGYYLTAPDRFNVNEDGTGARMPVYYSKKINPDNPVKNAQVWNIQYNQAYDDDERKRYTFVTSLNDGNITGGSWDEDGVGHFGEGGSFCEGNTAEAQSTTNNNHIWRNFSIFYDGTSYCFYNIEKQWSLVMMPQFEDGEVTGVAKMETTAGVKKFYCLLVPMDEDEENYDPGLGIDNSLENELQVAVMGVGNSIVIANAEAGYSAEVYDISGHLVKKVILNGNYETIDVKSGLYIVRVTGENTRITGKVIVR